MTRRSNGPDDPQERSDLDPSEAEGEPVEGEVVQEERRQIIEVIEARLHRGPLPSGEALAEYDRARPGTSDEIVEEWREEAKQRRELQRLTVETAIRSRDRGQLIGAGLALIVIVLGFIAIFTGQSLAGVAALVLAAAAIAGRFVAQRAANGRAEADAGELEPPERPAEAG